MCGATLVRPTLVRATMGGPTLNWYPKIGTFLKLPQFIRGTKVSFAILTSSNTLPNYSFITQAEFSVLDFSINIPLSHYHKIVINSWKRCPSVPLTRAQMCVLNFFPLYCIDESAGGEGGEKKNGEWVQCNLQPSRQITFHLHITSKFLFACVSKSYVVGRVISLEVWEHYWKFETYLRIEFGIPMIDRPLHLLSLSNQSVIEIENL